MSIIDALDKAAADLAQHGIALVRSANGQDSGDAWCDAVEQHGERIALIHIVDGEWLPRPRQRAWRRQQGWFDVTQLKVSYPWEDVETGAVVRAALVAQGLRVEWAGSGRDAIHILDVERA